MARLTLKQAEEIRRVYKDTSITVRRLAKRYGVNPSTISRIINNKTHVRKDKHEE